LGFRRDRGEELTMPDYLLLMHDDAPAADARSDDWGPYLAKLKQTGSFQGGSAIGSGICVRKSGAAPAITDHLDGFIRIHADDLAAAERLLAGNPVFEAGGTIEIRELPKTE
jgi:hypothetical protein